LDEPIAVAQVDEHNAAEVAAAMDPAAEADSGTLLGASQRATAVGSEGGLCHQDPGEAVVSAGISPAVQIRSES
jgi:hypothetical protein